jgi:hypothetical protein
MYCKTGFSDFSRFCYKPLDRTADRHSMLENTTLFGRTVPFTVKRKNNSIIKQCLSMRRQNRWKKSGDLCDIL